MLKCLDLDFLTYSNYEEVKKQDKFHSTALLDSKNLINSIFKEQKPFNTNHIFWNRTLACCIKSNL